MKQSKIHNRLLIWLLITALIITMAPFVPNRAVEAAPSPSLYFQFQDFSIDSSFPTEVNSNLVDIVGTYSNVTNTTISYKIEQITTSGSTINVVQTSVGSTKAVISGQNFSFSGVTLYSGINRITILGTSTTGNNVTGEAFINFSNVPAITETKLIDGRDLLLSSGPLITTNATEGLTVKAPNSTEVSVNGVQMFPGTNSSYVLSNIQLTRGSNKLTIIAKNANKSYEITKYLVYFDGSMTVYDLKIGNVTIDGNPKISRGSPLTGAVTAKVIMALTSPTPTPPPAITFKITGGTVNYSDTNTTVSPPTTVGNYNIYSITFTGTAVNPSISSTGNYTLQTVNTVPAPAVTFDSKFYFRNTTAPFINDIKQVYGVTVAGSAVTYTSFGSFLNNSMVSQVPLWLYLDTSNFDASDTTLPTAYSTTITAKQNGVLLTAAEFAATATYTTGTGNKWPAIQITKMPTGLTDLTITISDGTNSDAITRKINYFPVSSIQVDSIYDGKTFTNQLTASDSITGKLVNFDLTNDSELDTLMLSFNGVDYPLVEPSAAGNNGIQRLANPQGGFSFNPAAPFGSGAPLQLVLGANTLIFKGTAGGIPVTTSLTVYYTSSTVPSISAVRPVPFVADPLLRVYNDLQAKFVSTDTKKFNTTDKMLDLLFDVKNITNIEVQRDGIILATAAISGANLQVNDPLPSDGISLFFEDGTTTLQSQVPTTSLYSLRISGATLPTSGLTNFTIIVRAGAGQVAETVAIVRDLSPYIILSPKLPDESVINSNFLNVSIKAEGASKILLGKLEMVKGPGDIFRLELKSLKPGNNTIKFTVSQGAQKINGTFSVNYAADNSISAQYKAKLPNNGKLTLFKSELTMSFPKNTFLRQANRNPGQDVQTVDLFDSQELYFGIADRNDGRTVKKYNAVGEKDFSNNYLDGSIINVPTDIIAADRLRPQINFSYSSNLFWVDAGYFKLPNSPSDPYTLINAETPYAGGGDIFYARVFDPNKWLEPSQRGTISIQYDPNVRDALAQNLSVWKYTSNSWENVGGVVNTKKKTVTAPFDGFGYYAVMSLRFSFSDIVNHDYARLSAETMFSHGIMANKDINSFGVYDNISRGEFAQMIVKMLDIPLEYNPNNMTYDDVLPLDYPGALWNYRYIETAARKGLIRGISPKLFLPNDPLTREQASVMLARALNMVKSTADPEKDRTSLQKSFTDANTIEIYSASSILAIVKAKFIAGITNTAPAKTFRFEPDSFLKRADAAVIGVRVMQSLKKL